MKILVVIVFTILGCSLNYWRHVTADDKCSAQGHPSKKVWQDLGRMVVGVFPIAKLGALLIKQISKPLSNFVKNRAKNNHFFRTYICMPPAQFYNWWEVKAKMWVMNLGKPVSIPSLNEAMAIELGANLLGETIVFGVAAGILYMEYARQVRKEAAKEEARLEEILNLTHTIQELYFQAERQDTQLRELTRTVTELESQVVTLPWKGGRKTPSSDPSTPDEPPPSPPSSSSPSSPTNYDNPMSGQRGGGIITNAIAYLQASNLVGLTNGYSAISFPVS